MTILVEHTITASAETVLLGDIGATNARFSLLADGAIGPITWIEVARYPHFADAVGALLQSHLQSQRAATPVSAALFAVAGPVDGGRCAFTNCAWTIDHAEMRDRFAFDTVHVVNDFEATALSLPHLEDKDLHAIGGGRAVAGAPMAVLGPGSGLGVACLVGQAEGATVIPSEGGHASMAAASRREDAILDHLRERFGHVSAERVLSGPGLENVYAAIAHVDRTDAPPRTAVEVTNAALQTTCPTASAALDMFCAMLGSFAGNLALTYGARGGVYIAGGIAPRILGHLAGSTFRERFAQKGRFRAYLEAIPTRVIIHPAATFLGLRALAGERR
jgi:glucokinase